MRNFAVYPGAIGSDEGPCSESCHHIVCMLKRSDARKICPLCELPIGLGNAIYKCLYPHDMVHKECLDARILELIELPSDDPDHDEIVTDLQNFVMGVNEELADGLKLYNTHVGWLSKNDDAGRETRLRMPMLKEFDGAVNMLHYDLNRGAT